MLQSYQIVRVFLLSSCCFLSMHERGPLIFQGWEWWWMAGSPPKWLDNWKNIKWLNYFNWASIALLPIGLLIELNCSHDVSGQGNDNVPPGGEVSADSAKHHGPRLIPWHDSWEALSSKPFIGGMDDQHSRTWGGGLRPTEFSTLQYCKFSILVYGSHDAIHQGCPLLTGSVFSLLCHSA